MATLVLSTVGTALGGPVGGAIGSLIGQSIDQQLLSSPRRGPRLGDLSVQTSSYGTEIPRIYGTMRVAGSIIWATDLVESSSTSGVKGQPDVSYSYSVSFAVALSSRPVREIRRIWADGNLLRGADGDFKVSTGFRFYDGSGDQPIDPLIGSVEGAAQTPAYRGFATAVFDHLELAQFGNRIPFLTFELVADEADPTIADILKDVSAGSIAVTDERTIGGYAAAGSSMRNAVQPLIEAFDVELVDGNGALSSADARVIKVGEDELGSGSEERTVSRLQREQDGGRTLPATVTLTYYEASRQYQLGTARADGGGPQGAERRVDLPAVLSATAARELAEDVMARSWARRERVKVSLPPTRLDLRPGSRIALPAQSGTWRVERSTIDSLAVQLELRPDWRPISEVTADPGRANAAVDEVVGPATFVLAEVAALGASPGGSPAIMLAASTAGAWRPLSVEVTGAGLMGSSASAVRKSVLGQTIGVLGGGSADLVDETNSVDVQLVDAEQWLTSCDMDALIAGANLALIGDEILQFGVAEPLGNGVFRLGKLVRGRGGTEWAISAHAAAEPFILVDPATIRQVAVPASAIGSVVTVQQVEPSGGASASLNFIGRALRPWSPVGLNAVQLDSGDVQIAWARRTRLGSIWLDDVDVPLGEQSESYAVSITTNGHSLERTCSVASLTVAAADVLALGTGAATVSVRQIGDWGASIPASTGIILN